MSSTEVLPAEQQPQPTEKKSEQLDSVVIRFCGDSGDGMQLVGTQFTNVSAAFGNDVSTLVAMNPAALKTNMGDLRRGGTLIVNEDEFEKSNLHKAGYEGNPLE